MLLIAVFEQYKKVAYAATPKTAIEKTLQNSSGSSTVENVSINSSLGFNVGYNKKQFTSVGYVIGKDNSFKTYDKNDVFEKRDYAIVNLYDARLKSKDNIKTKNYSSAELNISTSILKDFFEKRRSQYGTQFSELDLVEKHYAPKTGGDIQSVDVISKGDTKVNGITYRKVIYKIVNTKLIKTTSTTEAYYLVKDGKPFAITLTTANDRDQEFVASLRGIITNVSYGTNQQSAKYGSSNSASGGKVSKKVSDTALNTPYKLKSDTALKVVAKNQPATVRIGMAYCAKVTLKLTNGQPFTTLDEACNAAIGSGSIISDKGYVSTNGHVVTMKPNDVILYGLLGPIQESGDNTSLVKFLQYMSMNGQAAQVDELIRLIESNDQKAIDKLSAAIDAIPPAQLDTTGSEKYQFAIQLGKAPLRLKVDGVNASYVYIKDQIVSAKLVDKNFNVYDDINTGTFTRSDVAVLKINDKVTGGFPVIKLGSINGLKENDLVTAIGYPYFVDSGTDTKQKYTFPTATQGKVLEIGYDSPGSKRKVVNMTTPIAAGNSGGPAFSKNGLMIGLNTYGQSASEDEFSISSIFRDVADLKQLLDKNNVSATGTSELSKVWSSAIDDFSAGQYVEAQKGFAAVSAKYPSFYLADSFLKTTNEQIEAANKENNLRIMMIVIGIVIVAVVISLILFIRKLIKHNRADPGSYIPNQQTPPITQQFTQAPVSQQPPVVVTPTLQYPPVDSVPTEPIDQTTPVPLPQTPQQDVAGSQQTIEVRIDHNDDKTNA
ncbi:MAG: trypsin-like peptidase domain-containing protein [Candidatus Saccharibacteria bacterium]|nr:trypsin-like peptidase domain-containing protein [Candidatus Saccharibacteria bacterium]